MFHVPPPTRERFRIEGGYPLTGTVRATGNKNGALPIVAAAILGSEPVTLGNVPDIVDVLLLIQLLSQIGVTVERLDSNTWRFSGQENAHSMGLDAELCERIRGSLLVAGPLLARFGEVLVPVSGGDVIGRRRVDTHVLALEALGATFRFDEGYHFTAVGGRLTGGEIHLDEPSVTGTENAVMAAVLAKGRTLIENAACEPHVQDLCRMLVSMGAKIEGIGSNMLWIDGVDKLGGCEHQIGADHIEIGSFIGLAAVTGGEMVIEDAPAAQIRPLIRGFARLGVQIEQEGNAVRVPPEQRLRIQDDMGSQIPKIEDGPWPQFPADLTSIIVAVATQCQGTVMVFEKMFESRLVFTDNLVSMGARIILCDPHRAVISGPSRLTGAKLVSPDIRAGMAMLIAALCADGTSTIQNIWQIDRGYERIDERLRALGAHIERIP
jgi:UDP-N-acetylglucosamine 1-carboxyvinyltransferase